MQSPLSLKYLLILSKKMLIFADSNGNRCHDSVTLADFRVKVRLLTRCKSAQ